MVASRREGLAALRARLQEVGYIVDNVIQESELPSDVYAAWILGLARSRWGAVAGPSSISAWRSVIPLSARSSEAARPTEDRDRITGILAAGTLALTARIPADRTPGLRR
jgi:hypothetical protein